MIDLNLTKSYFKLLQALHHLEILQKSADTFGPKGMLRQVDKLTAFIKPSSPNASTLEAVKLNTSRWCEANFHILTKHYDLVVTTGLEGLEPFNQEAFNKAVSWSKARYRRKFTISSANTLQAKLLSANDPQPNRSFVLEEADFAPLSVCPPAVEIPPIRPRSYADTVNRVTQSHHTPPTVLLDIDRSRTVPLSPVLVPASPIPNIHTGSLENIGEAPPQPPAGRQILVMAEIERATSPPILGGLVLGGEAGGVRSELGAVVRGGITSSGPDGEPMGEPFFSNVAVPCSNDISPPTPEETEAPPIEPANPGNGAEDGGVTGANTMDQYLGGTWPDSFHNIPGTVESSSPGGAARREPRIHPRTERKIFDWNLEIIKPIVVVGDSNLARIPSFVDPRVQVDSFPGATADHLRGVLCKLPPSPMTEKVIISVGLNNCLRKQTSGTAWKQLQQVLRVCDKVFPNAELHVPVIHFSDRLPQATQNLIRILNDTIVERCQYLPAIPRTQFRVEGRDPVHWVGPTAAAILKYWLRHLNMLGGKSVC